LYELVAIVTNIVNLSFASGKVPSYWLNALVTPDPRSKPDCVSDFRLISVTAGLQKRSLFIVGYDLLHQLRQGRQQGGGAKWMQLASNLVQG